MKIEVVVEKVAQKQALTVVWHSAVESDVLWKVETGHLFPGPVLVLDNGRFLDDVQPILEETGRGLLELPGKDGSTLNLSLTLKKLL